MAAKAGVQGEQIVESHVFFLYVYCWRKHNFFNYMYMRKYMILLVIALVSASCATTLSTTATYADANASFRPTTSVADVKVSETKISYTYYPTKMVIRGGYRNTINEAVHQALCSAGDYDVLIAKETYVTVKNRFMFGRKIKSVTVTGYPGKYINWHSIDDLAPVEEIKGGIFGISRKRK